MANMIFSENFSKDSYPKNALHWQGDILLAGRSWLCGVFSGGWWSSALFCLLGRPFYPAWCGPGPPGSAWPGGGAVTAPHGSRHTAGLQPDRYTRGPDCHPRDQEQSQYCYSDQLAVHSVPGITGSDTWPAEVTVTRGHRECTARRWEVWAGRAHSSGPLCLKGLPWHIFYFLNANLACTMWTLWMLLFICSVNRWIATFTGIVVIKFNEVWDFIQSCGCKVTYHATIPWFSVRLQYLHC